MGRNVGTRYSVPRDFFGAGECAVEMRNNSAFWQWNEEEMIGLKWLPLPSCAAKLYGVRGIRAPC